MHNKQKSSRRGLIGISCGVGGGVAAGAGVSQNLLVWECVFIAVVAAVVMALLWSVVLRSPAGCSARETDKPPGDDS